MPAPPQNAVSTDVGGGREGAPWLPGTRSGPKHLFGSDRVRRRRRRRRIVVAVLAVVALLLPVPWLHVVSDDPLSHAWRLDGRLYVQGEPVDPPGRWSWLAVGRPPLVIELMRDRVVGTDDPPADLRTGSRTQRPALSEPAAVAVGLRHAGLDVPMRVLVEVSQPLYEGLPERAIITRISGIELTNREVFDGIVGEWETVESATIPLDDEDAPLVEFATQSGGTFATPGPGLPYERVSILDLAPLGLEAGIAGPLTRLAPVSWFRNLSLGSSHGTMVALVAYTDAAQHDLAQGRHIAGTGGIRGDGTVTRIGGLRAKARAAKRAGADVMFYPASQAGELETFDPGHMAIVPIDTLAEAIVWLGNPVA